MTEAKDLPLEKVLSSLRCFDCHGVDPGYMVHYEVWAQAWPDYHQTRITLREQFSHLKGVWLCLCFNCLEKRLGRSLVVGDFTKAPINDGIRFGYCLRDCHLHKESHLKVNAELSGEVQIAQQPRFVPSVLPDRVHQGFRKELEQLEDAEFVKAVASLDPTTPEEDGRSSTERFPRR